MKRPWLEYETYIFSWSHHLLVICMDMQSLKWLKIFVKKRASGNNWWRDLNWNMLLLILKLLDYNSSYSYLSAFRICYASISRKPTVWGLLQIWFRFCWLFIFTGFICCSEIYFRRMLILSVFSISLFF